MTIPSGVIQIALERLLAPATPITAAVAMSARPPMLSAVTGGERPGTPLTPPQTATERSPRTLTGTAAVRRVRPPGTSTRTTGTRRIRNCANITRKSPGNGTGRRKRGPVNRVRVLSKYPAYVISSTGIIQGPGRPGRERKWLSPCPGSNGYYNIYITDRNGVVKQKTIHSIVCLAFHGDPEPGQIEIRHINGNKLDNRAENLAWGTQFENVADRRLHGTMPLGENHPGAKLTWPLVREIRYKYSQGGTSFRKLAAEYHVSYTVIAKLVNHRTWIEA